MRIHRALLLCAIAVVLAGSPPAAARDPLPPKRNLRWVDRAAWQRVLKWPADWEDEYRHSAPGEQKSPGMDFHALGARRWLIEVQISLAAYQGEQIFYCLDESRATPCWRLLRFPLWSFPVDKPVKETTTRLLGISGFDERRHELTNFCKFRGIGDCGTLARYSFSPSSGAARMVEFRAHPKCDGAEIPAEKWARMPTFQLKP